MNTPDPTGGSTALGDHTAPAGLASIQLRPAVRLLTERPTTIGEMVSVSGVSRRGIESLLATWHDEADSSADDDTPPGDSEAASTSEAANHSLKLDDDRYRVTEPLRSRLVAEWDLDAVSDGQRFGQPAVRDQLSTWADHLPRPRRELDHRPATPDGVTNRLDLLDTHLDLRGAKVLVLGARDLDALALTADGQAGEVAAVDVDDAVLAAVDEASSASPTLRWCDVRVGLPASLVGWADLVITDPPYTPEGMAAFLAAASAALCGPKARVAVSYGYGETRATLGWQVQREMLRANLALCAMWPDAVSYEGAEAIGGRADLYLLAPTGREQNQPDIAHHLYTQGPAAARSATELDAQPVTVAIQAANKLARDAAAGNESDGSDQLIGVRRLLGSDQAPKVRAGAVPVIDIRGDPGGWLPRTLLALPTATAMLVCDVDGHDRSPDPRPRSVADGRGWVEQHLSGQWQLEPADRAAEGADLLIARRVESSSTSEDGETPVPPLVGRGHANPRNVIAEWMTRSGDPESRPTRREARAAATDHLASLGIDVRPGDSLIGLPLHRIAALLASPAPK